MTIKASALLAAVTIWAAMIPAVALQGDAWWSLVFAALATVAVASSFWRRIGISRVLGVAGAWAGTSLAIIESADAAWVAIFAFLTTGVVLYSAMRRTAVLHGVAIAAAWLAVGACLTVNEGQGAWMVVFAFLTAGAVANSRSDARAGAGILWWVLAAGVIVAGGEGWTWVSVIAFLLTASSIGFGDFRFPTGIEWDLFGRGGGESDDGEPEWRSARRERREQRRGRRYAWREFDTDAPETAPPGSGPQRIVIVERDDEAPEVR